MKKIVIIGNSAAGLSALENFRKHDQESQVTVISKEGKLPYSRVLIPYILRKKIHMPEFIFALKIILKNIMPK